MTSIGLIPTPIHVRQRRAYPLVCVDLEETQAQALHNHAAVLVTTSGRLYLEAPNYRAAFAMLPTLRKLIGIEANPRPVAEYVVLPVAMLEDKPKRKRRKKRTGKPCTWNGIEYPNVATAALANNVSERTMHYRLNQGYTCEDDLNQGASAYPVRIDGQQYRSYTAAAEAFSVNVSTIARWVKAGKAARVEVAA